MLCKEGRVEGAIYKGVWLIPRSAKKPKDPRRINKKRDDMDSNIRGILGIRLPRIRLPGVYF